MVSQHRQPTAPLLREGYDQLPDDLLKGAWRSGVSSEQFGATLNAEVCRIVPEYRLREVRIIKFANQLDDPAIECMCDVHQPREADPVEAALVFLNLLKGEADSIRQARLRNAQALPSLAYASTKRDVHGAW